MIYIASDHAGFAVKEFINEYLDSLKLEYKDLGPHEYTKSDDYYDFAELVCNSIKDNDLGILICDTGIGMSIAANRHRDIRAALCSSVFDASRAREHENANVIVFGAETNELDNIKTMVKTFLNTDFSNEERHIRRIKKLS